MIWYLILGTRRINEKNIVFLRESIKDKQVCAPGEKKATHFAFGTIENLNLFILLEKDILPPFEISSNASALRDSKNFGCNTEIQILLSVYFKFVSANEGQIQIRPRGFQFDR